MCEGQRAEMSNRVIEATARLGGRGDNEVHDRNIRLGRVSNGLWPVHQLVSSSVSPRSFSLYASNSMCCMSHGSGDTSWASLLSASSHHTSPFLTREAETGFMKVPHAPVPGDRPCGSVCQWCPHLFFPRVDNNSDVPQIGSAVHSPHF